MHKEIRLRLIETARKQTTVTYSELAPLANLNMENPADRDRIAELLLEISEHENREGRPLLSVLVVHKDGDMMPGNGFFKLGSQLGLFTGNDRDAFFIQEMNRVYQYWNREPLS